MLNDVEMFCWDAASSYFKTMQ